MKKLMEDRGGGGGEFKLLKKWVDVRGSLILRIVRGGGREGSIFIKLNPRYFLCLRSVCGWVFGMGTKATPTNH